MDSIVTARVPSEIKEQGNDVLRAIGATPTQLVNAAYEYVLAYGKLPRMSAGDSDPATRALSAEQKKLLRSFVAESTYAVPESYWGDKSYKDLIEEGRRLDYEALA